jgi:hypothetical protein
VPRYSQASHVRTDGGGTLFGRIAVAIADDEAARVRRVARVALVYVVDLATVSLAAADPVAAGAGGTRRRGGGAGVERQVKLALDESRVLVLGTQVLLGFALRAPFERAFDALPAAARRAKLADIALLLLVLALLLLPAAYHQIVAGGAASPPLLRFATRTMDLALAPFALALGLTLYTATVRLLGTAAAAGLGLAAGLGAAGGWYAPGLARRAREGRAMAGAAGSAATRASEMDLVDRVDQALTEVRIVLPGAQALLGFQLATFLMDGFERLPRLAQYVHLASLLATAGATILLIAPPAYHRVAEQGGVTERLRRFTVAMLLAALACLAVGLAGDLFVVVTKLTGRPVAAAAAALAALAGCNGLWFGLTFALRGRRAGAGADRRGD